MKKSELMFNVLRLPVDYLALLAAGLGAYYIRFSGIVVDVRPALYEIPLSEYFVFIVVIAALWIFVFALVGLYSFRGVRGMLKELGSILSGCSAAVLLLIVIIFFRRELFSSRFIVLVAWGLSLIFVSLGRIIMLSIQRQLFRHGIGTHKVLIIGDNNSAQAIEDMMNRRISLGYKVIDRLKEYNTDVLEYIKKTNESMGIDEVIQADPHLLREQESELVEFCHAKHITFKYVPNIHEARSINVDVQSLAGIPILELIRTPLDGWGRVAKRALDVVGSVLLIIITSPIMLAVAIALKIEDGGSVFYRNGRVGYKGKIFEVYKFRSYKLEYCTDWKRETGLAKESLAEKFEKELIAKKNARQGPLYKIKDDPRITKVGALLRKTSIDEIPQFFNVLKGEMSLVGPRPHQPKEVAKYNKHHLKLLAIKPGVTGMAQISGRSDLHFEEEAKLDIYYIENWSLLWDIIILLKTPFALLRKRETI